MVSYDEEWKQCGDHSGWTFSGKENKGLSVSREITYANLIDCLYDLLGFDKSKYDLVLKVGYQLGRKIISPTMISNDEDLGFFLDEKIISIQHWTHLCISVVERTIHYNNVVIPRHPFHIGHVSWPTWKGDQLTMSVYTDMVSVTFTSV